MRAPVAGIFVGLTTLDTVYGVARPPSPDEKIVAQEFFVGAGGPATNAAVTFAHLGGRATLLSAVGTGPLADFVRSDVEKFGVRHVELSPGNGPAYGPDSGSLPVSAVLVTSTTGERAVISAHEAVSRQAAPAKPGPSRAAGVPRSLGAERGVTADAQVVLLDGHRPEAARDLVGGRLTANSLVVLDGGSWKDQTDTILPLVDVVVCSASFRPPGTSDPWDVLSFLLAAGPSFVAMTNGSHDVVWACRDERGSITPPAVDVRDTLGAGDVFHGAFAWSVARQGVTRQRLATQERAATQDCVAALEVAARVAARSVEHFGPRTWTTVSLL